MERYRCNHCGHVYDPVAGEPRSDIPPETSFDEVLDSWGCPTCGADKSSFAALADHHAGELSMI